MSAIHAEHISHPSIPLTDAQLSSCSEVTWSEHWLDLSFLGRMGSQEDYFCNYWRHAVADEQEVSHHHFINTIDAHGYTTSQGLFYDDTPSCMKHTPELDWKKDDDIYVHARVRKDHGAIGDGRGISQLRQQDMGLRQSTPNEDPASIPLPAPTPQYLTPGFFTGSNQGSYSTSSSQTLVPRTPPCCPVKNATHTWPPIPYRLPGSPISTSTASSVSWAGETWKYPSWMTPTPLQARTHPSPDPAYRASDAYSAIGNYRYRRLLGLLSVSSATLDCDFILTCFL
jgi:hypothetical protein